MGKGSKRRPEDTQAIEANWDRIFRARQQDQAWVEAKRDEYLRAANKVQADDVRDVQEAQGTDSPSSAAGSGRPE